MSNLPTAPADSPPRPPIADGRDRRNGTRAGTDLAHVGLVRRSVRTLDRCWRCTTTDSFVRHPSHGVVGGPDGVLFAWFLQSVEHSLAGGHSPFISPGMNAPAGVSLMWNTSLILPAIVLAPLTALFGGLCRRRLVDGAGSDPVGDRRLLRAAPADRRGRRVGAGGDDLRVRTVLRRPGRSPAADPDRPGPAVPAVTRVTGCSSARPAARSASASGSASWWPSRC